MKPFSNMKTECSLLLSNMWETMDFGFCGEVPNEHIFYQQN